MAATVEQAVIERAQAIAQAQGRQWDARLEVILRFCARNPAYFPKKAGIDSQQLPTLSGDEAERYFKKYVNDYYIARERPARLLVSSTVPDPAIDIVLKAANPELSLEQLKAMEAAHRSSMAAENVIGDLLERYIARTLEMQGWVWCCGSTVRDVDFLRITKTDEICLQVKNRSNSENAPASRVRVGTPITKWYRIDAKSGKEYWERFPGNGLLPAEQQLSETGFHKFIRQMLEPRVL